MEGKNKVIIGFLLVVVLTFVFVSADPDPTGATLDSGPSSRGTESNPQFTEAQAGNVTALNINFTKITDIWQGFFGNVSGEIVLENSAGNNFYDWSITEMTGEVYATRLTIPDWSQINCTNNSQWEMEEYTLGISNVSTDGINETYSSFSHPEFLVGNRMMTGCPSTRPYNSTSNPGDFWNVMLNSNSTNTVYASILADDSNAFDGSSADFEILVPVDRATGISTYYFYAELN